jgi:hypothetical protein
MKYRSGLGNGPAGGHTPENMVFHKDRLGKAGAGALYLDCIITVK